MRMAMPFSELEVELPEPSIEGKVLSQGADAVLLRSIGAELLGLDDDNHLGRPR